MCADIQVFKNQLKENGLKKLFGSMSLFQKISLVFIAVVVVVGLFSLIRWTNKPEYVILYNNLSYEESAAIVENLNDSKIEYQLSSEGSTIKVKKTDLANSRLALASEGIPNNSVVGFELFDQQFFGLTDFTQQVNYQRALEGELSRTISEIEEVSSARVHLVLADDELFTESSKSASASVVLKLKTGKNIGTSSVIAIKNLVSNAVEQLDGDNISIIDTNGNLLTSGDSGSQSIADQQNAASSVEREIENKISAMLIKLVGPGNSIVSVKADINIDQKEAESETYLPGEDGQGVALVHGSVSESYNRASGNTDDGDVSGIDANVPIVEQEENKPQYGEETGQNAEESNIYNRDESETQYGVSRIVEKIKYGTGDIERLSVGVFLNSKVPEDKIEEIESVIIAAAGIDKSRGDNMSIKRMNFAAIDAGQLMGEDGTDVPISNKILDIAKKALPGGLIVILLLLLTLRSMGIIKKKTIINDNDRKNLLDKIDTELDRLSVSGHGAAKLSGYGHNDFKDSRTPGEREFSHSSFTPRDERLGKDEKRKKIMEIRKKVIEKMDETMYAELKEVVAYESSENPQAAAKAIRSWLTGNI